MTIPDHVKAEFDRLRPVLERALAHGPRTHDADDVWALIESGRSQVWALPNSVVITEVAAFPKGRALRLQWAAGRLGEILAAGPQFRAFATQCGCRSIIVSGRAGWERVLRKHGFSFLATTVVMEI